MFQRLLATALLLTTFATARATEPTTPAIQIVLQNSIESIGVGLAPTANVLPLIPEGYIPVGIADPVTPIVVRTARGDISILGQTFRQKSIVQIGAVIVPPDGTGDINNYTLFYYTDDVRLYLLLRVAGVDAQFAPLIQYRLSSSNALSVRVPFPASPRLTVAGNVTPSPAPSGSFVANWWQAGPYGSVKMETNVPVIKIGGAALQLTTPAGSELATLAGNNVIDFPIIQQFNTFAGATLKISLP